MQVFYRRFPQSISVDVLRIFNYLYLKAMIFIIIYNQYVYIIIMLFITISQIYITNVQNNTTKTFNPSN